jgi:hypothetical protein
MKKLILKLLLLVAVAQAPSSVRAESRGSLTPQVENLKERILKDDGIMVLINSLQNDPEIQALLSDPAMMGAIQAMDIATLIHNPVFMKLLNNLRIQEIEKKIQPDNVPR